MARFAWFLFALIFLSVPASAQSSEAESAGNDTTASSKADADWLVLPFASYSPETKFSGGGSVGYYRPERPGGAASSVQTAVTVTQKRQLIVEAAPELYLRDGRWRVQGRFKATHFPNSFYGIGGGTPARAEESFTSRYVRVEGTAQKRIDKNLRVGPRLFVRAGTVTEPDSGGLIDRGRVPGAGGGVTAGLGGTVFWDARNSLYYPTSGSYAEVVATMHSAAWGSDYAFGRLTTDLRAYRALGPGVLAGQVYTESVAGTVPFQLLPLLGGSSRMRGYRVGRFRDNVYWTTQAEYRFPLFWRFKATAFATVGEVGPRLGTPLINDVEAAVGLGGRLRLTDDGVHGRLDVAYSRTGLELYLSLGEAF